MNDRPVLYSFRRCPYAMRARWALLQAGLLVSWREIELRDKPEQMLEVSPKGTVPVLVLGDDTVIDESLAMMHWALSQADPRNLRRLGSGDQQTCIQKLIELNDTTFKHHLDRFKYTDRYPGESKEEHRRAGLTLLRTWSQRIDDCGGWLVDSRCSLADGAIWPFVRQWRIADPQGFDSDDALRPLRDWLSRFLDAPDFERLMQRADPWHPGGLQPRFPADAVDVPTDQPLFHLALAEDWTAACQSGDYGISTRGLRLDQVGFIHLSWQEQVAATFERFYADAGRVVMLTIDPTLLTSPLRADASPSGELFPHLYGRLPIKAVIDASSYPGLEP
tara:strand:+ start:2549 stop:3550 length:1002 start_codon:yes stop_codon:yes gene_type:complete